MRPLKCETRMEGTMSDELYHTILAWVCKGDMTLKQISKRLLYMVIFENLDEQEAEAAYELASLLLS